MQFVLVNVKIGHPRYEELIGQLRTGPVRQQMWQDAEHELTEHPDKVWSMAIVAVGDRWVPAAWAAAQVIDGELVCSDNYERRGFRGPDLGSPGWGLYPAAYTHRHATVVEPSGLPARTFIFKQPRVLHEQDGWYTTGETGVSRRTGVEHRWWELRREPTIRRPELRIVPWVVPYPGKGVLS